MLLFRKDIRETAKTPKIHEGRAEETFEPLNVWISVLDDDSGIVCREGKEECTSFIPTYEHEDPI
jgi:hypothetical protein